jgi:hypothetical protein
MATDEKIRVLDPQSHWLLCDRTGQCAALEFLRGETVYHTGDDLPVKALTNTAYRDSVKAWRKGKLTDQSLIRFGIAADGARDYDATRAESPIDYAFDTLYMADGDRRGGPSAQWSIVFDAQNLRIHFRTKRVPQIRTIELDQIDFACDTPPLMLDIHEDLSGDISHDFGPYSHDRSVDHFYQFFQAWQMDVSREASKELVQHLEAFACGEGQDAPPSELPAPPAGKDASPARATGESRGSPWWIWLVAAGILVPAGLFIWLGIRKRTTAGSPSSS